MPDNPIAEPSWLKWPPNCCESCIGWLRSSFDVWVGRCEQHNSLDVGSETDARYRCPAFQRREGI